MNRQALRRLAAMAACFLVLLLPIGAAALLAPGRAADAAELLFAAYTAVAAPAGAVEAGQQWLQQQTAEPAEPAETAPEPAPASPAVPAAKPDRQALINAIPEERRGVIEEVHYAVSSTASNYFHFGAGCLRNASDIATASLQLEVEKPFSLGLLPAADEPQVLIVHTHTTESYDPNDIGFYDTDLPTRSTEDDSNMIAVGEAMVRRLAELGIGAVHATEYHDYPSYTGAYTRSRETIRSYLARYPSIRVVLDLHRDGIQREDGTRVKPTATVDGQKAAQLMLVVNADNGSGNMPYQMENLRFAAQLQDQLESHYPGLARPVLFDERNYNQDLLPGSLLVEIGSESSTLEEAKRTACLLADCLAALASP